MSVPPTGPDAGAAQTPGIDIVDSIDVPTIVIGGDGAVVRFNPAAATLLSLTLASLLRPAREIPLLKGVKRLEELCQDAIGSGNSSQCEVRGATDGSWFVLRIAPCMRSEQKVDSAVLTFQNVTAFRASLDQAVYEREYTKAILNTVIDSLVVLDDDCRVQAANQAFYTKFQVSRDQAHGARLYDIGSQDWEVPRLQKFLKEADAENQSAAEFELEFPAIGRRAVMLNARRLPRKAAQPSQGSNVRELTLLVIQDITERKQAELPTASLAAIVDSSDDAIVSKSLDGVITSWNAGAERLFGYTAKEAVGQPVTMIIPLDRRSEETIILARLRQGERIDHFDTVRLRKDGTKLEISLTISPIRDAAGKIIGASKIARDITARKRVERELHESEQRFRTLADALDTQVQFRTQELRRRNAEILQQSDQLRDLSGRLMATQDQERRRIARDLHDSAGQNLSVLAMTLARIEDEAKRDPAQLSQTVKDARELIEALSQEIRTTSYLLHPPMLDEFGLSSALGLYLEGLQQRSGLSIELNIPSDFGRLAPEVELAIFRLVQECLTNIHRHSGSKTAVIRIIREPDKIYAEVQDHGKGMSPERFAEVQSQGAGVGVGIRGMRERVRQAHGELTVDSNALGTTITAIFPVKTRAANEPIPISRHGLA
jgi:PAS domain S-box-containing protein